MKTPVRTRLLSALLSLVMLVSLLPVSVFAAEPASGTWEKVTEAQEDWSGQYLIVYEKGSLIMDGSLSALDKEGNKVDVTITDGKITAAPADARMDAEVMVGGSGTGDHPTFMALTLASDALKELGFNLIVSDMSNFSEMANAINAGNADMFAMAWQATPDPDMFQIYHSQGGSNEKSYWIKDAELDDLIMQARQSTDQTYRKTLYKECLDIVADWAVEIPVYQRQNCIIISSQRVNLDTVTPDITTYWQWYNDLELLDLK